MKPKKQMKAIEVN